MSKTDPDIDVNKETAMSLIASGSRMIWVLGGLDAQRHAALQNISEKIYDAGFEELMASNDPRTLTGDAPLLVCEHGITSHFVAEHLRKFGIKAYSLEGGVEELRRR